MEFTRKAPDQVWLACSQQKIGYASWGLPRILAVFADPLEAQVYLDSEKKKWTGDPKGLYLYLEPKGFFPYKEDE